MRPTTILRSVRHAFGSERMRATKQLLSAFVVLGFLVVGLLQFRASKATAQAPLSRGNFSGELCSIECEESPWWCVWCGEYRCDLDWWMTPDDIPGPPACDATCVG